MTQSKSPAPVEVKVPCITCGRECPDGLRYCLYCGGKTLEIDKPTMPMDPHCPECGEEDELNITFCVSCGAKLNSLDARATAPKFARKTGFNWTLEDSPPPAIRMAMRNLNESPAAVRVIDRPSALKPGALGILSGLVAAAILFASGFLPYLLARATWPRAGLVVYCPAGGSDVLQFSLENLETHVLTVAPVRTGATALGRRAPGCLVLRDLPAGNYMMKVQKGSSTTAFGLVTLAPDRPTVVGYPDGIQLPI